MTEEEIRKHFPFVLCKSVTGRIGDFVFRTSKSGKIEIRRRRPKPLFTALQKVNHARLAAAAAHAHRILSDPVKRAHYIAEARRQKTTAYCIAMRNSIRNGSDDRHACP